MHLLMTVVAAVVLCAICSVPVASKPKPKGTCGKEKLKCSKEEVCGKVEVCWEEYGGVRKCMIRDACVEQTLNYGCVDGGVPLVARSKTKGKSQRVCSTYSNIPCPGGFFCSTALQDHASICCPESGFVFDDSVCQLSPERGMCRASIRKYFYNSTSKSCEEFQYGGCRGNGNNFDTMEKCQTVCLGYDSVCKQPKVVGICKKLVTRYFYNAKSKSCEMFAYGGCGGNSNNFDSMETCQNVCSEFPSVPVENPGKCPNPKTKGSAGKGKKCKSDEDCKGDQKCCRYHTKKPKKVCQDPDFTNCFFGNCGNH